LFKVLNSYATIHFGVIFQVVILDVFTRKVKKTKLRDRSPQATIPTERPPLVGEVSANLCEQRVLRGQSNEFPWPLISVF
jgi:hypothetical protein